MFALTYSKKINKLNWNSKYDMCLQGEIIIDDFRESFNSSLTYWTINDYLYQWKAASNRVLSGYRKSAFFSNIIAPELKGYYLIWPIYRVGKDVYIQNAIILVNRLRKPFDESNLYKYIKPRHSGDDDSIISEWVTDIEDIRSFNISVSLMIESNST